MSGHSIIHIEISAKDRAAAANFYTELFGWKMEDMPEMNYVTWEAESGPGGGFNPVSEENPAGTVLVYVSTGDIEADLKKAVSLGGKVVVSKTEIPSIGWFGIFEDPSGNRLGLYTDMQMSS